MAASLAWGGLRNGFIPASALVAVGRGFLLERVAAAQFLAARAFIYAAIGVDIVDYISETYRDWDGQVYQRARWTALGKPNNAAIPGSSVHGWAKAIDFDADALMRDGIYDFVMSVLERFGFIRDVSGESWHVSFREAEITTWATQDVTPIETAEQREERELMSAHEDIVNDLTPVIKKAALEALKAKLYRIKDGPEAGTFLAFNRNTGVEWKYTSNWQEEHKLDKDLGSVGVDEEFANVTAYGMGRLRASAPKP